MNLKEIIEKQQQEAQARAVDEEKIQKHVAKYKEMVESFYNTVINDWLKDLNDDGLLQPEYQDMTINEELTGEYHIRTLNIMMANTRVRFRPIGTFLIGTPGRIDMYVNGNSEPAMFIIVGEKATSPRIVTQEIIEGKPKPENPKPIDYGKSVWKYVDRSNRMHYVPLDARAFQQIIMSKL